MANVPPALAWNTAASFVTNTNWQNYSGESTMGYLVQMAGLAVQNFVSAAVGIVVAIALVRGFIRSRTDRLGNFWVDLTRITVRYLMPLSVVGALILVAAGVIDNFSRLPHGDHAVRRRTRPSSAARWPRRRSSRTLGNNGGGFFNANSSHPFENPNPFTNWFEIFLLLLIAFCLPRTFGKMVKDNRQGYALLAVMAIIWLAAVGGISFFEAQHAGHRPRSWRTARWRARTSLRHPRLVAVRGVDDGDVDRGGELLPRLVHPVRRRHRAVRHRARRDRARRRRSRAVRHAGPGHRDGVRRPG